MALKPRNPESLADSHSLSQWPREALLSVLVYMYCFECMTELRAFSLGSVQVLGVDLISR